MDSSKVGLVDRVKYRALLWLKEKAYERPVGFLLKDGVSVPSLQRVKKYFSGRPIGLFIPYEVYLGRGIYKNEDTVSLLVVIENIDYFVALSTTEIHDILLHALPINYIYQWQMLHLCEDGPSTVILTITASPLTSLDDLIALGDVISSLLIGIGCSLRKVGVDELLMFLRELFHIDAINDVYDKGVLIRSQVSGARIDVDEGGLKIRSTTNVDENVYVGVSQVWRKGKTSGLPLSHLTESLPAQRRWVTSFNFRLTESGVNGQLLIMEYFSENQEQTLHSLLSSCGWLLESDRFNAHLSLMSCLPCAIGYDFLCVLEQNHRWQNWTEDEVADLLAWSGPIESKQKYKIYGNVASELECSHG